MAAQTQSTRGGIILYDDALVSHAHPELFSPQHGAAGQPPLQTDGGRGQVWILAGAEAAWVLRHYRRGGLARCLGDLYLWTGLERTRPWREWKLLAELYKEGLPVPRPVAARVVRNGPCYRGDLITCLIPGCRSLASLWKVDADGAIPWASIGACIRRLHDAGVYHADLNAHNILVDNDARVFIVDFDRGRRRSPAPAWRQANLRRLQRSLRRLTGTGQLDAAVWSALLQGYGPFH